MDDCRGPVPRATSRLCCRSPQTSRRSNRQTAVEKHENPTAGFVVHSALVRTWTIIADPVAITREIGASINHIRCRASAEYAAVEAARRRADCQTLIECDMKQFFTYRKAKILLCDLPTPAPSAPATAASRRTEPETMNDSTVRSTLARIGATPQKHSAAPKNALSAGIDESEPGLKHASFTGRNTGAFYSPGTLPAKHGAMTLRELKGYVTTFAVRPETMPSSPSSSRPLCRG